MRLALRRTFSGMAAIVDVAAHGASGVVQLWDCISGQGNQKWKMY